MSTGQDLIVGGLLNINAISAGQQLSSNVGDSLNTDEAYIYTQVENIFSWTPGTYQYSVGNPQAISPFLGTVTQGLNTITGVTVPPGLVQYSTLTDSGGALPANTVVTSIVGSTVTMNNVALSTPNGLDQITYTTPGNIILSSGIPMSRPIRIISGYTRVTGGSASGLDYPFEVISFQRYNEIGFKGVPGPWPFMMAYQPTYPLGTLWIYQNPGGNNEVHLFTDLLISEFTLTQDVALPPGYARSLKKLLGLELCPMFGKTPSPQLIKQAKEAKDLLYAQNSSRVATLRYDADLVYSRHSDAGWILTGGFN
jgi:hypothetical protein